MEKKLPIYQASIEESGTGMFCVSLVSEPAVEVSWQLFNKTQQTFRIQNEEQKCVLGVVMLADVPIYRFSPEMGEYYIQFSKETIEKMVQKFFKEGYQEQVDTNHSFNLIDGIELQQAFIKNTEKGISPIGFEEVPDGSLFFTYKVTSDELWDEIKTGSWTGFSLAGVFDIKEAFSKQEDPEEAEVMQLIEKLRGRILR
jgi:hypothetical protein